MRPLYEADIQCDCIINFDITGLMVHSSGQDLYRTRSLSKLVWKLLKGLSKFQGSSWESSTHNCDLVEEKNYYKLSFQHRKNEPGVNLPFC